MNSKVFTTFFILLSMLANTVTWAAGEAEYILEKKVTSITPVFMTGHQGDFEWIEGLQINGENYLKGSATQIGTFSATANVINPPLRLEEYYDHVYFTILNTFPELGTFQVTGIGISLGSSGNAGDTVFAYSGSISNGTGIFENNYGLSAGNAVSNIFAGGGAMTEVINIRTGY